MALSTSDKNILEEIASTDGHCMSSKRCERCPFRAICLPEFLNPIPPSREQRLKMAQDVLAHHYLIDNEVEVEDIKKDFKWDKK
jgi:hypothetical protein